MSKMKMSAIVRMRKSKNSWGGVHRFILKAGHPERHSKEKKKKRKKEKGKEGTRFELNMLAREYCIYYADYELTKKKNF